MVGMPKGVLKGELLDLLVFCVWSIFVFGTLINRPSKVVLEVLLDVPEVLLEVLDLSWTSWMRFWASTQMHVNWATWTDFKKREPAGTSRFIVPSAFGIPTMAKVWLQQSFV